MRFFNNAGIACLKRREPVEDISFGEKSPSLNDRWLRDREVIGQFFSQRSILFKKDTVAVNYKIKITF